MWRLKTGRKQSTVIFTNNGLNRSFWLLLFAALVTQAGFAQSPQLPQPRELLLEVDLRIDNAASATSNRAVTLDFVATEKSNPGHLTVQDDTLRITHYRALEDGSAETLAQQSWLPITRRPPYFNLAEFDKRGER